jgi:hypothetical protein
MTTIAGTDIPSNINTVERLVAWGGYLLAYNNPTLAVLETQVRNEKAAQAIIFQAADDTYRLLIRACLPISQNYIIDRSIKSWMHVQELSNVIVPAGFKVN